MQLEQLRDLVIIISGLVVTLVALLVAVVMLLTYGKVNRILKSAKTTAAKIEAFTTIATEQIGKPLIGFAAVVQGVAHGISAVRKTFKKKGE